MGVRPTGEARTATCISRVGLEACHSGVVGYPPACRWGITVLGRAIPGAYCYYRALVIITHNLGIIARHAQRVNVMYAGRIIEKGTAKDIYRQPKHPYTIGLMASVPRLDRMEESLVPIDGIPPNLIEMPPTCGFLPRCSYATDACREEPWPNLRQVGDTHWTACRVDITRTKKL